ncbi:MAG TPA: MFS transporter [Bacteroidales bacterium]|nr:MAG: hypothetical protein A2W98_08295 [Bacteroidetes bacterium GWF2_33_38]OFY76714.1 MAG: hypothetical protein A2265_02180 [Bacteroidetes bacterium RIFOXYA12_FULL_33_9]HBF87138.1 MFS transporter [Bacteroidales bacterium]
MKNFEVTDIKEIEKIIANIKICHVGFVDGDKPYVIAFNFGYKDRILYLHTAKTGRKIDILRKNNNICISMETESVLNIRQEQVACSYSMKFKSVVIEGRVEFIENFDDKVSVMNIIMSNYTDRADFQYNAPAINGVEVMKVNIDKMTARKRGY